MRYVLLLILLLFIGAGVYYWLNGGLTQEELRSSIITKLESEAPESFLVTGFLEINTVIEEENTKSFIVPVLFLPLPINLGTTKTTLKIPGKVSYGFNVQELKAEDIILAEDGVIEVNLPELSIYSTEPHLDKAEVQTEVGWARLHSQSGQAQEKRALSKVEEALRLQAQIHMENDQQSRINTAQALETMLAPVLEALGMVEAKFRFVLGGGFSFEPEVG